MNAQDVICQAIHARRFRFPAVAANLEVLNVSRKHGEWIWEVYTTDFHDARGGEVERRFHFRVLDRSFSNVVRIYVPIPGNPEPFLVGTGDVLPGLTA